MTHGRDRTGQAAEGAGVVSDSTQPEAKPDENESPYAGLGELLEADDATVFKTVDGLVRQQEHLAKNRYALDKHYTESKQGYWQSSIIKVEDQNSYKQSYLPGTKDQLRTGAIPNKQADLCQKLVETLLVDPPKLDPEAEGDDESAQRGAELAREFLDQDATESGTDDLTLHACQLEGATTRASTFNHYWVDPSGAGSVPKQIKAHPLATDPANPLVGLDPVTGQEVPTTDYVLRYVTEGGQFTRNPSEAERVWVPRLRADKLNREHVRLFPETADLHHAQAAVVLYFSTVAEARRRWPETVGELPDTEWSALCQWSPKRGSILLPEDVRQKWRDGRKLDAEGSQSPALDQRFVFWYRYVCLSSPDYPQGADLYVNGANGGFVFGRDTLTATVEVPSGEMQDEVVEDRLDLDLPLNQYRLLADVDRGDPMGAAFMGRIAGAGEAEAQLATAMLEAIDQALHPVRYSIATSPLDADDVETARATGDFAQVSHKDDIPQAEPPRDLPGAYFNFVNWLTDGMDSSAGIRPPDRAAEAKVKSGIALRIEVSEATKQLTRMNYAFHVAASRHGRIKVQLAMKHFDVPQLIRYVGSDGTNKAEWFRGNDFARVSNVRIKTGTGTMLPPIEKVNLAIQLGAAGLTSPDETADAARPAFAKSLGVGENPHVQRAQRQKDAWLEGPPEGWEAEQAKFQQEVQVHAALAQQMLAENPTGGPEVIPPAPVAPWTPFAVEPMDAEPPIAAIRKRMLADLMATVAFSEQPEPWKQMVRDAYAQTVAPLQAAQTAPQPAKPVQPPTSGGVA